METDYQVQLSQGQENVKVFLRIESSKKGTDFTCPCTLTESKLVQIILEVINTNHFLRQQCRQFIDKAAFVIQGHRINSKDSEIISLRPDTIIHIVEDQERLREQMKVTFRYQNPQQSQDFSHQMQVKIDNLIEGEVQNIAPLYFGKFVHQLSFVYLGAEIPSSKTFKDTNIGENSEIILIDKLKNQNDQVDPFASAQYLPLEGFLLKPRTIQVEKKDSIEKDGFDMPFNPTIEANKVKMLLEQNVRQTELFIQQQQQNALLMQNPPNHIISNDAPQLVESEIKQEKMDSEKEIPTKEEIEAQNQDQNIQEQPSDQ